MENTIGLMLKRYFWLINLVTGIIGTLIIWFALPHKPEIDSAWQVIIKISIFIIITFAIAFFPNNFKFKDFLVILPLFVFVGFLIPRATYFGYVAIPQQIENAGNDFYTHLFVLFYPTIIFSICFAYRIGGGSPGNCIKISLCGIIILFSGFLDFLWYTINPVKIPEVLYNAHHIKLVIGHFPSYTEAIIFTCFHIPLLGGIIFLPIDKYIKNLGFS